MNWITISVALTVFVCISFDHGYAGSTAAPGVVTPAPGIVTPAPSAVTSAPGAVTSAPGNVTPAPGNVTPAPGVVTQAPSGNNTGGSRNGGPGAGEFSAKVLMIATMAGCTLAVYGGL